MKKNENGITLLILVITVIVLTLITVPIIVNTTEIPELQRYTYFKADIDRLRESIQTAYLNINNISTIGIEYTGDITFLDGQQNGKTIKNPNDNNKYYIIDLRKLNSYLDAQIELEYGNGNKDISLDTDDIYIINEQTRTIYYVKGVLYKNIMYYRLGEEFTELENTCVVSYNANGGTNVPNMQTLPANSSIILANAPTKQGYRFVGWKEEETNNIYNAGETFTVQKYTVFVAQWEIE